MLTRVPAPLLTSGLVFGKEVSFAIGTKPPTSWTIVVTLLSIALVVAILLSASDQLSVLSIVSVSAEKYLASASALV